MHIRRLTRLSREKGWRSHQVPLPNQPCVDSPLSNLCHSSRHLSCYTTPSPLSTALPHVRWMGEPGSAKAQQWEYKPHALRGYSYGPLADGYPLLVVAHVRILHLRGHSECRRVNCSHPTWNAHRRNSLFKKDNLTFATKLRESKWSCLVNARGHSDQR